MHRSLSKYFFLPLIVLLLPLMGMSQSENKIIEYDEMVKAYRDYDTAFFHKVNESSESYLFVKGKKRLGYLDGLTPILDWHLNHRGDISEYRLLNEKGKLSLEIYCIESCDKTLSYAFKVIGSKPQITFKKGRRNWFKIKALSNLELISMEETDV